MDKFLSHFIPLQNCLGLMTKRPKLLGNCVQIPPRVMSKLALQIKYMLVVDPYLPDPKILFQLSGMCVGNSYVNPWYWVNRSIFPWYFFPIKERIITRLCIVLYCIENNLCDCVRETVRARRGSAAVLLQVVSLHLSRL